MRLRQIINRRRHLALGVLLVVVACAKAGSSRPESSGTDRYYIEAKELHSVSRDNLYDAVHQLRPGWFTRTTRQRSGEDRILVYLDDRQVGDASTLRRFSAQSVESVRYLSPTEAQVRFGQINVGRPAIVLVSARGP